MAKRTALALATLTATALATSGCMSISWERDPQRAPNGFSAETAPPQQALESAAADAGPTEPPGKPKDVAALWRGEEGLVLSWSSPSDSGGGKVKYQTRISEPDKKKYRRWSKPSGKTKAKFNASTAHSYRLQVRAVNDAGKGQQAMVTATAIGGSLPRVTVEASPSPGGGSGTAYDFDFDQDFADQLLNR